MLSYSHLPILENDYPFIGVFIARRNDYIVIKPPRAAPPKKEE
jgi:hypothetical protein